MSPPPEPTPEQLEKNAEITWHDSAGTHRGFAAWYPQMGGYVGKAVVLPLGNQNDGESPYNQCFDVFVWHDGDFPFSGDRGRRDPTVLHHCRARQFVEFGEKVMAELTTRYTRRDGR